MRTPVRKLQIRSSASFGIQASADLHVALFAPSLLQRRRYRQHPRRNTRGRTARPGTRTTRPGDAHARNYARLLRRRRTRRTARVRRDGRWRWARRREERVIGSNSSLANRIQPRKARSKRGDHGRLTVQSAAIVAHHDAPRIGDRAATRGCIATEGGSEPGNSTAYRRRRFRTPAFMQHYATEALSVERQLREPDRTASRDQV
jgi:hypothetical protein